MDRIIAEEITRLRQSQAKIDARQNDLQGRPPDENDLRLMRDHQSRADGYFRDLGLVGAPAPLTGESAGTYRRRLVSLLQPYSPEWRDTRIFALPDDTIATVEQLVFADAQKIARHPTVTFVPGTLRERRSRGEDGLEMIAFHGSPLTWMKTFMAPGQAVRRILNPQSGRQLYPPPR